jgi:hypothetical protein
LGWLPSARGIDVSATCGKTENVFGKQELFDLAAVCEEVANSIEDRLTGG